MEQCLLSFGNLLYEGTLLTLWVVDTELKQKLRADLEADFLSLNLGIFSSGLQSHLAVSMEFFLLNFFKLYQSLLLSRWLLLFPFGPVISSSYVFLCLTKSSISFCHKSFKPRCLLCPSHFLRLAVSVSYCPKYEGRFFSLEAILSSMLVLFEDASHYQ